MVEEEESAVDAEVGVENQRNRRKTTRTTNWTWKIGVAMGMKRLEKLAESHDRDDRILRQTGDGVLRIQ